MSLGSASQTSSTQSHTASHDTSGEPRDAVEQLRSLGDPDDVAKPDFHSDNWPNYVDRGLTPADVPRLIRMADQWYGGDVDWDHVDWEKFDWDDPPVWAPVHAWRALGQLRAVDATEPLLRMLDRARRHGDDWAMEELPEVFALIGPSAIEPLGRFLLDPDREQYARGTAGTSLVYIARAFPEARGDCVGCLTDALKLAENFPPDLNGFLVGNLLDLKAKESAETIERAFAGGWVDEGICGDWYRVRKELDVAGLGLVPPQRQQPKQPRMSFGLPGDSPDFMLDPHKKRQKKQKEKAKRKQQQQAKKRNRRAR